MSRLLNTEVHNRLIQGAVVLTPNDRLARSCKADFEQQCVKQKLRAWETPLILPVATWLSMLFRDLQALAQVDRRLLSEEQSQLVWKSIIENSDAGALLSIGATIRAVSIAWELEHLYVNDRKAESFPLSDDQRQYQSWRRQYVQFCEQGKWIDSAALAGYLVAHLDNWPENLPEEILLAGFTEQTPSLKQLFAHLQWLGVTVSEVAATEETQSVLTLVASHDDDQELLDCARWTYECVQQLTAGQESTGGTVGVVIPDLHARRDEILRTFDSVFFPTASPAEIQQAGRPYDLSLGVSLSRYAIVDHAQLLLQLAYGRVQAADLTRVLLSPHLTGAAQERDARASLDAALRARQVRSAGLGLVRDHRLTPSTLRVTLQQAGAAVQTGHTMPSEWLERFVAVLDAFGWPGEEALDTVEHQTMEAWRQALESLHSLDAVMGEVSWQGMLTLLQEHMDRRVFQPQTPDVPVWILGVLESQGLQFSQLRILGLDNEAWPAKLSPSPFLPLPWQKLAGVPGASPADDVLKARKQLDDWAGSSGSVVLSYAMHRHGSPIECSPMIQALVAGGEAQVTKNIVAEQNSSSFVSALDAVAETLSLQAFTDVHGPGVTAGVRVRGGARLLEDQAHCPFRAFALHRLGIRELEEPGIGIDPRDKGTLFHATVQYFWQATGSQQEFLLLDDEALDERLQTAVDQAFAETRVQSAELRKIEKSRVHRSVKNWLTTHEQYRDPFTVVGLEASAEYDVGPLRLKLAVDRVDQLDDGGTVVIDYKTGRRNSTASWKEERITSPQLPLYATLQDQEVVAVCFAQVALNQQRFIGMGVEKGILPGVIGPANEAQSWSEQLQDWRHRLESLAIEVHQGVASVTPGKSACAHCPLPALCRVDATVIEAAEDAAVSEIPS